MNLKGVIFFVVATVFLFSVTSSALAASAPDRAVSVSRTQPCKKTPALVAKLLPDAYCCEKSDFEERIACLS